MPIWIADADGPNKFDPLAAVVGGVVTVVITDVTAAHVIPERS